MVMKSTSRLRKLSLGWVWLVLATGLWPAQGSPTTPGGDNSGPEASKAQGESNALLSQRVQHQTDLFTGSFGYSIPIEGAPARNGTQPPLALVYSSSGENGWCGVGWNLDIGYIERNTKDGSPVKYNTATPPAPLTQYDDAKDFIVNLFGRQVKLKLVSGSEYRAEVDTDFSRYVFNTGANTWDLFDKSGNVYRFGQVASSRIANPKSGWSGASGTFRWALDEIQTATGDRTTITYVTSGTERMIYPDQISYNGHTNRNGYTEVFSPTHTLTFLNEATDRTDKRVSYRWGFRVEYNKRLSEIACKVGTQKVRRYVLDYGASYSPATKRSLLKAVKVYGADDTSLLPTQTFTYQGNTTPVSFQNAIKWDQLYLAYPNNISERCLIGRDGNGATLMDIVDIDGDGLPDRVRWNDKAVGTADSYLVQRNLGLQSAGTNGQFASGPGYDFGPTSSTGTVQGVQFIPQGSGWSALNAPDLRFLDVTGDGRPDRVADDSTYARSNITTYTQFFVQTNLGKSFPTPSAALAWPVDTQSPTGGNPYPFGAVDFVDSVNSYNAAWVRLLDLNGDGLPDRVMMKRAFPYDNYLVQFGTGSGFTPVKQFGPYTSQGGQNYPNWAGVGSDYVAMVDLNGDGLLDRVMLPAATPGGLPQRDTNTTRFVVEFNNGYGFETQSNWFGVDPQVVQNPPGFPHLEYCEVQKFPNVGLFDINGDGLPDRVMPRELDANKTNWFVQLNNGTGFDSVIVVSNINIQKLIGNQNQTRDIWFGIQGVGEGTDAYSGQTITAMMDMNGDGLPDRVLADYTSVTGGTGTNHIWVQLNAGPFPDLLQTVTNGIGGITTVTYKPSTAWDNRQDPADADSGKLLPFPIQTVATVTENDGVNATRTNTYFYEGGFYDGSRREFAGFAKVTATDPSNRKAVYFYHQGGGQDRTNSGEYQDGGNFAKRGMAYRIEVYGNDTNLYQAVVNQIDQVDLGNGRRFPFIQQTFNYDYPGGGTPRITATRSVYNPATGNLTNQIVYGEVTNVSLTTLTAPTDLVATDTQYHHLSYTNISGNTNILDHPDTIKLTSDAAGNTVVQEKKFTYNSTSGTLATEQTRICPGQYAIVTHDEYDTYGLPTRTTDAVGVQTKIAAFDAYHIYPNVARLRVATNSDSTGDHITYATNDVRSGLVTDVTDPMGVWVHNTNDVFFRLTQTDKTPVGGSAVWMRKVSYSPFGVIASGNATNYVHTQVNDGVDAGNGVESRTYFDGFGRPIQTRTEAEAGNYRVVSTAYDERGEAFLTTWPRFESVITFAKPPAQPAVFTGFDAAGRISQTRARVDAAFNGNGAFTNKTDSTGDANSPLAPKLWSYTNGIDPWWKIYTDEDGKVRRYQLDAFGRNKVIQEVDGANTYVTAFKYDLAGNLTHITNHNSEIIYFGHDDVGNVVAMADPHLGQWTYQRDKAGRVREQIDGKGQKVVFNFGATLSRLSTKQVYNAATQLVATATYTYDSGDANYTVYKGELFQVTDSEGWEKNGYDSRGRLLKTTRHLNVNNQDYTTSFTFNDADKIVSTVYPNSGPAITNEYHAGGTLKRVFRTGYDFYSNAAANIDEFGHVLQFAYGNGVTTTRSNYSTSKRLYSLSAPSVFTRDYRYSAADDVTYLNGSGVSATTIAYDNLHRIKTYTGLPGSGYAYDAVGNMTNSIESGTASTYGYGSARKQAVKNAYGKTYLYDKCGNMIVRRGGTTNSQALEYDAENRLVKFSQVGTVAVEYGYAANGQRLWKRSYPPGDGKLQVWIGKICEEKDGKTLFHVFAGGQRICTFEPGSALATSGGGGTATHVGYYYHQDHLGSSSVMSGSSGQQLEVTVWYPFGRTQTNSPQAAFKVSNQFTGQVKDEETGLYYYNARYYDPELGRFIQPDIIIADLGNPQSYNRYSYTLNNPLKYVDPNGHSPQEFFESVGNFAGGSIIGAGNVLNPVPVQIRGEGPGPSSSAEYWGRRFGENVAVTISMVEIVSGSIVAGGGTVVEGVTVGAATPIAVPAVAAGAIVATHGGVGVNNYLFMKRSGPSSNRQATSRPGPAPDNYRGRYNAARHAEGKARLPDDWDVHHRVPQTYRDHPEFKQFDFDAPSNLQGIKGSRSDVNRHQPVTNEWEAFRKANPNAPRSQIEAFAGKMDQKYAAEWFK